MKLSQKTSTLIALLLLAAITFNVCGMKRILEKDVHQKQGFTQAQLQSGEWVDIVGLILNENAPMKLLLENFDFKELPGDVQRHIIQLLSLSTTATTLTEAAYTIQSLSLADKKLNEMINEPHMSLQLIKNLAYKFQCSDQEAAEALKTPEAKRRLTIQNQLSRQKNFNEKEFSLLYEAHKQYVDLNFIFKGIGNIAAFTLLSLAAYQNNCPMIQLLLSYGADINKANNKGITALMFAVPNGHIGAVQCLLNNPDITINQQDNAGLTALMRAAMTNHCLIIHMLLAHGADINTTARLGTTALMLAAYIKKVDAVQCLLNNPNIAINQQDKKGGTALMAAIDTRNRVMNKFIIKSIVKLLLDAGADPELANFAGLTPLQAAQQTGDQEVIDLIQDAIDKKYGKK